jgi:multiple sugar transport system permease protein
MLMIQAQQLPKRRGRSRRNAEQMTFVLVVLIPMAIVFALFWIYPLLNGLWGSLTKWQGFNPNQPFVGLDNYRALLKDPIFMVSLKNTFVYTLMYLPLSIVLALLLAIAIEATGPMRTFFRTVYFLPVITSVIATALIWKWLYQPQLGLFNQLLELVGLPRQRFLQSTTQALPSIVGYSLWKDIGFNMVLFMAGLSSIDRSFYEAARVDGANRWQVFGRITLPLLQPTLVFVLVTGFISTLQVFGPIYIMSGAQVNSPPGGPNNATMVLSVYQWQTAFNELNLGYGAAMGMVLFAIILVVTLFQSRFLRTSWEY